jgi:hypothetical protein
MHFGSMVLFTKYVLTQREQANVEQLGHSTAVRTLLNGSVQIGQSPMFYFCKKIKRRSAKGNKKKRDYELYWFTVD